MLKAIGFAKLGAILTFATPAPGVAQIQHAVSVQLHAVSRYYPTHPVLWANMHIVPARQLSRDCGGVPSFGCNDGTSAWVANIRGQLSRTYSHEAIEIATGEQICDPVSWEWYTIDGVRVSAWMKPKRMRSPAPTASGSAPSQTRTMPGTER